MPSPILSVTDISKQFSGVLAVDRLSLTIEEGEIFALLGPNGAGKTTTIRMLMGIIAPDSGRIDFALNEPDRSQQTKHLGYLPEDRGLFKDIAIEKTLAYLGILRGMSRAEAKRESVAWLERLDLLDRRKNRLDSLSKGNQQKVQFAAAILHKPRFAVLDEPFSGFDPVNQDLFVEIIRDLRDRGTTLLLSAHQMTLVERLADRCLLMSQGREVASGTVAELRNKQTATHRLVLTLGEDHTSDLEFDHPDLFSYEWVGPRTLSLNLEADTRLSELLIYVAGLVDIRSIHKDTQDLHQIYVETMSVSQTPGGSE